MYVFVCTKSATRLKHSRRDWLKKCTVIPIFKRPNLWVWPLCTWEMLAWLHKIKLKPLNQTLKLFPSFPTAIVKILSGYIKSISLITISLTVTPNRLQFPLCNPFPCNLLPADPWRPHRQAFGSGGTEPAGALPGPNVLCFDEQG